MNLLAEDDDKAVYNPELQHESKDKERKLELPKRARFYQAILDTAHLDLGKPYSLLPETFIIFICTIDPFGEGKYKYTLETKCVDADISEYKDYTHKIFFNTKAADKCTTQDMKNMLKYIETGTISDEATQHLEDEVIKTRLQEEWRKEYMLTMVHDNDVYMDGYDSGYGSGQDKMATLLNKLFELDRIDDAKKVATDKNYRMLLLREFGIEN